MTFRNCCRRDDVRGARPRPVLGQGSVSHPVVATYSGACSGARRKAVRTATRPSFHRVAVAAKTAILSVWSWQRCRYSLTILFGAAPYVSAISRKCWSV